MKRVLLTAAIASLMGGALVAVEVPGPVLARIWGAFLVFSAYRLLMQGLQPAPKTP